MVYNSIAGYAGKQHLRADAELELEVKNSLGAEAPQKELSAVLYTDENFFSQGGAVA